MFIMVNRRVSQTVCEQIGASTRRIYVYYYGKCGSQVVKMLDRVGYNPIQDPIRYGTKA